MTLLYPEWIPGEHMPTGPIVNLVGLKIQAGGQTVAWRRDSVNMYAFHIEVPAGASSLDAAFDFISPPEEGGYSSGSSATSELAVLNWNQLVLYPQGAQADSLQYQATLRVPELLAVRNRAAHRARIRRARSNFSRRRSPLSSIRRCSPAPTFARSSWARIAAPRTTCTWPATATAPSKSSPELVGRVQEPGGGNGRAVRFAPLPGLSFPVHPQRPRGALRPGAPRIQRRPPGRAHPGGPRSAKALRHLAAARVRALLERQISPARGAHLGRRRWRLRYAHEGRPAVGLRRSDRITWARFWRRAAGCGARRISANRWPWTPRRSTPSTAGTWRPLEDTAVAAQTLYEAGNDYADYRRTVDYYAEGTLIWLDADVSIRQLSKGARSLDDFCRAFEGGPGGAPAMKPYNFEDVVAALNAVQPYDWAGFLNSRLRSTEPHAPLGGIEHSGWKLVYDGERSEFLQGRRSGTKGDRSELLAGPQGQGRRHGHRYCLRRPGPKSWNRARRHHRGRQQPAVHAHGVA